MSGGTRGSDLFGTLPLLVLSSESWPSSPSWLSSASGASEATETGTFGMAPLMGDEGEKQGVDNPEKKTTRVLQGN
jgi:hypothetical protein